MCVVTALLGEMLHSYYLILILLPYKSGTLYLECKHRNLRTHFYHNDYNKIEEIFLVCMIVCHGFMIFKKALSLMGRKILAR